MSTTTPFRFAVQEYEASSGREWKETARRVEDLGYSALHVADHYVGKVTGDPAPQRQELALMPALAVAAAVTERLKVGSRVACVDYHSPAVLMKEAATIDLLSDGRLELGLGAGWVETEYGQIGVPFDPAGRRVDRLGEVVDLVRDFFSGAELAVDGVDVHVKGYRGVPPGSHRPPIMIGGGARRVLTLAGRMADIVSLNFNNRAGVIGPDGVASATASETDRKIEWIRAGAGDRFDQLELEVAAYFTAVTDRAQQMASTIGANFGLDAEEMLDHPNALIGSVDAISDRLVDRRKRYGISYITVPGRHADAFAPVVGRLAGS
jgi:probable F420-dependent oxidoreductase